MHQNSSGYLPCAGGPGGSWRGPDRAGSWERLADLLDENGAVLVHPFIIGEMVLGGLSSREEALFARLPNAGMVPHEEVLALVRRRRLMRRGIGWIDGHLLASALTSSAVLWSIDADLSAVAADLNVDFRTALS